ncbi:aldehyde dehydrogenase family protein [Rhodococcus sp. LB1]|uniref:aldehyde dehydrogenase family protein n=1 Tax=Rhodococcus sp. LB1 TaxID=1807499 RepID=UPI00077A3F98|nr:aldehyde dehydrogenase family protein [Rhodococcus sp. LB1]KXX60427.1 aldehyde dehydrogenase [Rhodococcus sp. LB1]
MSDLPRFSVIGRDPVPSSHGDRWFPLQNPATGEVWAEALEAEKLVVDLVVDGAVYAYRSVWRNTAPVERGRLLSHWATLLLEHRDEIAELEATDVGHLLQECRVDVERGAKWLSFYAGMADKIEGRTYPQIPGQLAYEAREPFGVVAGVNPFNGNPLMFAMKAGPALAAGNCLILKAPELAPASSFRIGELALEAGFPPGVVNVVTGRGEITGKFLNEHPDVTMMAFTGSIPAARSVIAQSASTIMPLILELGGKSAVIVLEDADLDVAVNSILHSNFVKSGQSCVAGSRVFVPSSLADQLHTRFAQVASRVRVGDPRDSRSDMGALISRQSRDRVEGLVSEAIRQGATCLQGGNPATSGVLARGNFFEPTVLVDVEDDNIVAREEVFGPVMSVLEYSDVDEVLARANSLRVGLSAQIWGNDAAKIQHLAGRLEAGMVWINTYRAIDPTIPFGGFKESGYGQENGFAAIDMYTRSKAVVWDLTTDRQLPYT